MPTKNGIYYDYYEGTTKKDINFVFIHGTGCNRTIFNPLIPLLKSYSLYLPDLPGHGLSPSSEFSVENYIKTITDFIKDLKKVIIIGHSLGGALTIGMIAKNLPQVIGGIVISGALKFDLPQKFIEDINKGIYDKNFIWKAFDKNPCNDLIEVTKTCLEKDEVFMKDLLVDDKVDFRKVASEIKVPTIVFYGDEDLLVFKNNIDLVMSTIKHAKLKVMKSGTHFAFITFKNEFINYVNSFVEENKF